jgi:putative membrane protein
MRKLLLSTLAAAAAIGFSAPAFASADTDFVAKAIKGDNSEILLGNLAAKRGATPAVRAFGKTLARDHTEGRTQALAVAQQIGLAKPPTGASAEAKAEEAKLKGLHGAAFDQEFASFMVRDHQQDINDFSHEANDTHGPVAEFAAKTLPVLHHHLEMAQKLQAGAA